jgi:hypothetical protein
MDGAREQRAGQGVVDPRLTALDEGALLDGSPWNTICVDRKGEVDRPGTGPPEPRQGRPPWSRCWLRASR